MSVSLADISKQSGLSYQTVADILSLRGNKRDRYALGTRQRVIEIASQLGYRPNAAARAVATGRFNVVTLLLSVVGSRSYLPPGMLAGVLGAVTDRGYKMHVAQMSDAQLSARGVLPGILREASSDGLLIDYTHQSPPAIEAEVREFRTPCIWLNRDRPTDCVRPDDEGAAYGMTRELIRRGHRKIDYVCLINEFHYSCTARLAGYQRAMREAGLPTRRLGTGVELPRGQHEALFSAHLSEPSRPTAVVCYGEFELEALHVAARVSGLRVPADIELAAFVPEADDSRHMFPFLGMVMPDYAVGRRGIERLLDRIEGAPPGAPTDTVPARLVLFDPG